MNYKLINKYFAQKNYLMFVGIGVAALGVVMFALGWWWMIAGGVIIVGIALIAVSRESAVKGDEVDSEVNNTTSQYEERVIEKHHLDQAHASVITFTDYVFDGQTTASMKKGSDGKYRPKNCCSTCLFISANTLYVDKEIFSIVEDRSSDSALSFEVGDVASLSIADKSTEEKGGVLVRYHVLEIKGRDGTILTEAPITQNSVLYDKIEELNRDIKAARKAAAEKNS